MRKLIVQFAIAAAVAMTALPALAQAPAWPTRPVKFILPLGAGSGADTIARVYGERLSARWGQPVVVENRPGGDGIIAITSFLTSNDDHTLLLTATSAFTAHPYLHESLPYNPKDLIPVARMTDSLLVLAVPASLQIQSVADLVAMAKAKPGALNVASITGLLDFVFTGFTKANNLEIARVPYRDPVMALTDLSEGRIQIMVTSLAIVRAQVQAGRVKLLALTNKKASGGPADLPTVVQAGFPDLGIDGMVGLFSLKSLPLETRAKIAEDLRIVANDPEVERRMTLAGQVINPGTPDEFSAAINDQTTQAAAIGKLLGTKTAVIK
jgi:tripartite-type tricarboxylate transporter receptor subunit TctC